MKKGKAFQVIDSRVKCEDVFVVEGDEFKWKNKWIWEEFAMSARGHAISHDYMKTIEIKSAM